MATKKRIVQTQRTNCNSTRILVWDSNLVCKELSLRGNESKERKSADSNQERSQT